MSEEPNETNSFKNTHFDRKTFFRFGIMSFVIRLLVDVEARKPIGWSGVASLAIEVVISAVLFSLAWQAIINWKRTKSSK